MAGGVGARPEAFPQGKSRPHPQPVNTRFDFTRNAIAMPSVSIATYVTVSCFY